MLTLAVEHAGAVSAMYVPVAARVMTCDAKLSTACAL